MLYYYIAFLPFLLSFSGAEAESFSEQQSVLISGRADCQFYCSTRRYLMLPLMKRICFSGRLARTRVRFAERTSVRSDDARPVASIEVKPLDRAARSIRRTGCGRGRGVDPLGDSIRKGSSQWLRYFSCEREGVHERVRKEVHGRNCRE